MVILMKKIIFLIFNFFSFLYSSENYTFLVKEYNKEIELEVKIISNIAENLIHKKEKVSLFITEISDMEKTIYSGPFNLVNSCDEADFIYLRNNSDSQLCNINNKIYFTNNYDSLLKNDKFIGAFFWSKSRPNIVFVKNRLNKNNIKLPEIYEKFIEEF